jgi:excinuclease ABC subunit B
LRSERSLLQIAGRTARNVEGLVILYADRVTRSMKALIDETNRRREIQSEYNIEHNINPKTVLKTLDEIMSSTSVADIQHSKIQRISEKEERKIRKAAEPLAEYLTENQKQELVEQLFTEMKKAARELDFEKAAELRDEIKKLQLVQGKLKMNTK